MVALGSCVMLLCGGECDFAQVDVSEMRNTDVDPWDPTWDEPALLKNAMFLPGVRDRGTVDKSVLVEVLGIWSLRPHGI